MQSCSPPRQRCLWANGGLERGKRRKTRIGRRRHVFDMVVTGTKRHGNASLLLGDGEPLSFDCGRGRAAGLAAAAWTRSRSARFRGASSCSCGATEDRPAREASAPASPRRFSLRGPGPCARRMPPRWTHIGRVKRRAPSDFADRRQVAPQAVTFGARRSNAPERTPRSSPDKPPAGTLIDAHRSKGDGSGRFPTEAGPARAQKRSPEPEPEPEPETAKAWFAAL